jgi:hypothetical protein
MAKIHVMNMEDIARNLSSITGGTSFVAGYCLKAMLKTSFGYPTGVVGALYSCPYCGLMDESIEVSLHVFNPSIPLVEALERGKS